MGKLKDLKIQFRNIKMKMSTKGLTYYDFVQVRSIRDSINSTLCAYDQAWSDFYTEVDNFLSYLSTSPIFHTFSPMNINYMREHASLLPLVLANNKKHLVDVVGTNYYFSCQFHNEKTPSLRIKNVSNTGYCFGCGAKINPFTYLQEYENLKFRKVLQLLAQIYLFDVKYENPKLDSLVSKYQQVIMSEEYLFLLEEGLERFNKLSHSNQEIEQVNTVYEYQLSTIERIRNHMYDPGFVYE